MVDLTTFGNQALSSSSSSSPPSHFYRAPPADEPPPKRIKVEGGDESDEAAPTDADDDPLLMDMPHEEGATAPSNRELWRYVNPYFLGWIYATGRKQDDDTLVVFAIDETRLIDLREIRAYMREVFFMIIADSETMAITEKSDGSFAFSVRSKTLVDDLDSILFGPRPLFDRFPEMCKTQDTEFYPREFWRGFIEAAAAIDTARIELLLPTQRKIDGLEYLGVPKRAFKTRRDNAVLSGYHAVGLLQTLLPENSVNDRRLGIVSTRMGGVRLCYALHEMIKAPPSHGFLRYELLCSDAVAPLRENILDVGFELTAIKLISFDGQVETFGTGISVQCPFGFYFEMYATKYLSEVGYELAHQGDMIGPRDDDGSEIVVRVRKTAYSASGLLIDRLPFKIALIVPRTHHLQIGLASGN